MAQKVKDPNRHVRDYLAYYTKLQESPGYAVMLVGPWGIGKTYLLRQILDGSIGRNRYVYVSLYGLTSANDIRDAIWAARYPETTRKSAKIAGAFAKVLLKHAQVNLDGITKDAFWDKFAAADLFVFDDLERCPMPITQVLGHINEFVEHDGCKVVVVANEDRFADDSEYGSYKEKVVGKTLAVQSAFDEALSNFIGKVGDKSARAFLEAHREGIEFIYDQSQLHNLRILQQTIWDFVRIYGVIDLQHRANADAMVTLLKVFFALSFELKAPPPRLTVNDLKKRFQGVFGGLASGLKSDSPLRLAARRYPEVKLYDQILTDEVLVDILIRGIVDKDDILAALDASPWFTTETEPAWKTVWHYMERTSAQVEAAIIEMQKDFVAYRFVKAGEMLQVFGLMLMLSRAGKTGISPGDTVDICEAYVDEIRCRGQLDKPGSFVDDLSQGYDHLGWMQGETPEFKGLWNYVREQQKGADRDRNKGRAETLLREMISDADLFVRRINLTQTDDSIYAMVPILKEIEPSEFVKAFLAYEPPTQLAVARGLRVRYDGRIHMPPLNEEIDWLRQVVRLLRDAASTMDPIGKMRLEQLVQWYASVVLPEATEAE